MENWQLLSSSKLNIALHQPTSAVPLHCYNPHRGIINQAVFNHTNKVIASCGQDSRLQLRSPAQQTKLLDLQFHTVTQQPASVNCLQFSNKSKYIAAGAANGLVKVWDMKLYKDIYRKLKGHNGSVTSLAWINGEDIVASSSTAGEINLYRVATGAIVDSLIAKNQDGYNNLKVSEGEGFSRIAACTVSGSILVWDLNMVTKKPIYTYQDPQKYQTTCISISSFRPALLASSSLNSCLTFLDIEQKKIIKTVTCQQPLTCVTFHNNGHTIAVGGCNGGLWVYDLRKLSEYVCKYDGHETAMKSVCFAVINEKDKQSRVGSNYGESRTKQSGSSTNVNPHKSNPNSLTTINNAQQKQSKLRNLSNNNSTSINRVNHKQNTREHSFTHIQSHKNIGIQKQEKNQNSRVSKYRGSKQQETEKQRHNIRKEEPATTNNLMPDLADKYERNVPTLSSPPIPSTNHYSHTKQPSSTSIHSLQEKLISRHNQLREEMHDRFDSLHLQIIRQMELNMKTMVNKMEEANIRNKQLEEKVRRLESENQKLRKRTY